MKYNISGLFVTSCNNSFGYNIYFCVELCQDICQGLLNSDYCNIYLITHNKYILDGDEPKFKAFLDILLDLGEIDPSLTDRQIKSEVDTIIVGGQETVASTMFYTLLLLGCKTGVQEKVYEE